MNEEIFNIPRENQTVVEKVLLDDYLQYIHMVFAPGDGLPEHNANANVYMTVIRGTLSIALDGREPRRYDAGTLLKIPVRTKMNVRNSGLETLELIVVKAPAPTR
ncbi:MAG: cupin domain-containing protein [Eubacteriales bacterium]|nr:cupin domain-containing protein [Eubacteriales bacterium]